MYVCACMCACLGVFVEVREQIWHSCHVDPGTQSQFIRLAGSHLYTMTYIASPFTDFILILIVYHATSLKMFIHSKSWWSLGYTQSYFCMRLCVPWQERLPTEPSQINPSLESFVYRTSTLQIEIILLL